MLGANSKQIQVLMPMFYLFSSFLWLDANFKQTLGNDSQVYHFVFFFFFFCFPNTSTPLRVYWPKSSNLFGVNSYTHLVSSHLFLHCIFNNLLPIPFKFVLHHSCFLITMGETSTQCKSKENVTSKIKTESARKAHRKAESPIK